GAEKCALGRGKQALLRVMNAAICLSSGDLKLYFLPQNAGFLQYKLGIVMFFLKMGALHESTIILTQSAVITRAAMLLRR
ncbi:MAG: hypothetical protein KZQ59_12865, partial [Candidatus Thiodiazotropha sp. (ex Lucinoma aequizonata)]|nr:hypothetical protein [Candidatus Thiodiazotropha sp. (ex Lucinoma aequizonata)]MCU7898964.1 hypothetical protein [Candidatus Thiodiazotropha sp. (ex Lucinoma aequizonata)]MCU7909172.1 hypothetical protein [Candidatus Thiodiazotropha sp. (ex Lucinoma aequizonata)]MCU7912626.1 hypothetical protein [Candidatus Thiodiazotropha sp. (ex Lucinoma aequizonata)]